MHSLNPSEDFAKAYQKLTKGNIILQKQFNKALKQLRINPFYTSLKTHKVDTKKYQNVYSSWVSGDVRIIWAFDENQELVILVLETGTHFGSNMVYSKKSG